MGKRKTVHRYYVYILSNRHDTVFYVGVTNDLRRRLREHREKVYPGFTKRYNIGKLLYFEPYQWLQDAIAREKQLKRWSRAKKLRLVHTINPEMRNLAPRL
jgi:putative endonuclease